MQPWDSSQFRAAILPDAVPTSPVNSIWQIWIGRILVWLPALFLALDGALKIAKPEFVVKATTGLGYPEDVIIPLGVVLLSCVVLCVIPRTTVIGAILLTGYLGGAVASHVRMGRGPFEIAFPVMLGILIWSGLCLARPQIGRAVFHANQVA